MVDEGSDLPECKDWLVKGFLRYAKPMMAKSFHALAVDDRELVRGVAAERPIIVFGNHPGWWDPIVASLLRAEFFPDRRLYAPIDAKALLQYKVLRKMGFYGLDLASRKGAADFLRVSRAILAERNSTIWLTPEGRFTDPRDRATEMMPGLAHLVSQGDAMTLIPLAIEYSFWEERQPEALCRFGRAIDSEVFHQQSKEEIGAKLRSAFRENQDLLADQVIRRSVDGFRVLFTGGKRSWYDFFRSWRAFLTRQKASLRHGDKFLEIDDRGDR